MKKLIIIGGGGHAKVVLETIEEINRIENEFEVVGILDDNLDVKYIVGYPVIGKIDDLEKISKDIYIHIALGNNSLREKIWRRNTDRDFATLIHPSAVVSKYTSIGEGTFIGIGAVINTDAKIGKQSIINTLSIVEHECVLEDFVHLSYGVIVGANTRITKGKIIDMGFKVLRKSTI